MARLEKGQLKLRKDHTWRAKPGYSVFVLDRGAVRFDVPRSWVVEPDEDSCKIRDRPYPKDDACLAVSYMKLAPIDWSGVPLATLVNVITEKDSRPIDSRGEIVTVRRGELEIAWQELSFVDPETSRDAFSRVCLGRQGVVQTLITFEFWADQTAKGHRVWDTVIETMRLNEYIADPTRGPWGRDS